MRQRRLGTYIKGIGWIDGMWLFLGRDGATYLKEYIGEEFYAMGGFYRDVRECCIDVGEWNDNHG